MRNSSRLRSHRLPSLRKTLRRPLLEALEDRRLLATNITQYHVDSQSTGANLTETQLTPLNVNASDFGQLYNTPLDGQVYAEPLVLSNVAITSGGTTTTYASVVIVATEHDSLYAINGVTGAILWQRSFLDSTNPNDFLPGATSVTNIPSGDTNSEDIDPEVGITGTPVIDPSTNIIYAIPKTKEIVGGATDYVQRLHAINLKDGTDATSSFLIGVTTDNGTGYFNYNTTPVSVSGTGDGNVGGVVQFNALRENNRPALSLVNGQVYAAWASHGDNGPYHGWVLSWNVQNLSTSGFALSGVLCTDPNGGEGGIWGGGGGLTFDPSISVNGQPAFYFETGNGIPRGGNPALDANGFPVDRNFYESLVKVVADPTTSANNQNANGWGMKIADYFTPFNANALDNADADFGSGSPLVLPDSAGIPDHPHLIVAAGKEGKIYLVDRDSMGKFNPNGDNVLNSVYNPSTGISTPPVLINGSLSTPAYYHGTIYWVPGYGSNAWSYVVAPVPNPQNLPHVPVAVIQPTSETANNNFGYVPGSVMVTANGSEDPNGGIVWIMDRANGEIRAYSSLSLSTELWNSGGGSINTVKFAVPTIANGQVFVGTNNSLQVFGITGTPSPVQPPKTVTNVAATALSGTSVELTWTDPTVSPNFATSYTIRGSQGNGGIFTTVGTAGQQSTNFTITGLNPNTSYSFFIVSNNSAGASAATPVVQVTTTNQTGQTPTAPLGLGATPASGSEAYLTWTNTATNQTGFILTRATDSLFTQNVVTETLAAAPYYFTDAAPGMSPGNTYYYRLQATNSAGASSFSNTSSVNIPKVPPAPTNASAVYNAGQVLLSWTDHAGPYALGYQISRSVDGGAYAVYANTPETSDRPPSTQTFTDTNIVIVHTYTYQIVAQNVSGFSAAATASVSVLGSANLTLDAAGKLTFVSGPGVPDRLSIQFASGVYTLTDSAVAISVAGAGAGFVTGAGTSSVTISAAKLSSISLDTADNTDAINIISDAVPITITSDSGSGTPVINLGDPLNNSTISGSITNASNAPMVIGGSGTTLITGNLLSLGFAGVTLAGSGTITISGNINLGASGNLLDIASGAVTISGVISGTATGSSAPTQGLVGTYFNVPASQNLIQPASSSNSSWLGNQTPAVTAKLIGPIDFPDIANNGFVDNQGDPNYYNIGNGNNNVAARWYGNITVPGTGTTPVPINFATISDDGSMVYIDGIAVVSNNFFQAPTLATGLVNLTPGVHTIDIEYFQGGGGAAMDVQWDLTGGNNFVDIPNTAFTSIQPVNGVVMNGTGTLTLSKADTYLGATTINSGTLIVTANGATGPATAAGTTVNPGGAFALSGGVRYTTAAPITIRGTGPAGNGAIENLGGANTLSIPITVVGNATIGSDAGSLTVGGAINASNGLLTVIGAGASTFNGAINASGVGLNLAGSGTIKIAGAINLGANGNLIDSSTGQDTITGKITGASATGYNQGLNGTYFNLPAASNQIQPADPSNPAWLGNQLPSAVSQLIGPIDFPNIAANGFLDSAGDPNYFNVSNNVEARWYGGIVIPGTGTTPVPINFATTSDDGSMLYIDGQAVVSNNFFQGATTRTGVVNLTPGIHTIDVEFYQGVGGASMIAQWDPAGGNNFVDIPNSAFVTPVNDLLKTGTGTLTLSNTNAYSGYTAINAGTLIVTANGATGPATAAGIIVNPGGAFALSGGFHYNTAEPITINGNGPAGNGAIENIGGNNLLYANSISLAGSATIGSDAGTLTIGGNISNGTNALTLIGAGGITVNGKILGQGGGVNLASAGGVTLAGSVALGAQGNLNDSSTGNDVISGVISGNQLSKTGSGNLTLTKVNTFVGTATLSAGNVIVDGSVLKSSGVTVTGGTLAGGGALPATSVQSGGFFAPGDAIGSLSVGNLTLAAGAIFVEQLGGSTPGSQFNQAIIPAGKTLTLGGSTLNVTLAAGFVPTVGQQFTIIRNLGGSAVNGTFSQGSILTSGGLSFGISYTGGAGNDVVLTYLGQTSTVLTSSIGASTNAAVYGQPIIFTATVAPNSPTTGTPIGSVTFMDGSLVLLTVPLTQGVASFIVPALSVGAHNITATFNGINNWLGSQASFSQLVNQAVTSTTLASSISGSVFNQSVTFTASVSPTAPGAGTPSGTVTFMDGNSVLGTVALNGVAGNDQATLTTTALSAGTHNITAVYSSDANFLGSSSVVAQQSVSSTPRFQNGVLAIPGSSSNATITLVPFLPAGATSYSLNVYNTVGATTTKIGTYAATNVVVYGGPGTNPLVIYGTTGNDSFTVGNGTVTENASQLTTFVVAINGVSSTTINGIGGTDGLTGPNQSNTWLINGRAAGLLNSTIAYQNIANLTGGNVSDTFTITPTGAILGNLTGVAPTSTLDFSQYGKAISVNLQSATANAIKGTVTNITSFVGSGTNDTLIGANAATTWTITGSNSGTVGGLAFSAFRNLTGGSVNDTFVFMPGGALTGNLNAGLGANTLDDSGFGSPVTVNLQTSTATGVAGTATGFQTFVGTGTTDSLIGQNAANAWSITGSNSGTVGNYRFSGFPNLVGGTSSDNFTFVSPGSLSGSINGLAGNNVITGDNNGDTFTVSGANSGTFASSATATFSNIAALLGGTGNDRFNFLSGGSISGIVAGGLGVNTLDESGIGIPVTVNLQTKTATGIGVPWTGLQNFIGTGTTDTLIGANPSQTWTITGLNAGGVGPYTFSGFPNISAGSGNDSFKFVSPGSITGTLNGGGGINMITGDANGDTFTVNGINSGSIASILPAGFSNIQSLVGGAANDSFVFLPGGSLAGTINAGLGVNTLNSSGFGIPVTVNLQSKTATGIASPWAGLQNFIGTGTSDTLVGPNATATWTINGLNAGTAGTFSFSGFPNLTGGTGTDNFIFVSPGALKGAIKGGGGVDTITGDANGDTFTVNGPNSGSIASILPVGFSNIAYLVGGAGNDSFVLLQGSSISGTLYGGGGVNTLNESALGVPVTVNLQTKTATGIANAWSNLQSFVGTGTTDNIIAANPNQVWTITGVNSGNVGPYAFSGFPNLTGGAGNDVFRFAAGSGVTGVINGTGGTNTLDYSNYGSPVTVNLGTGTTGLANNSASAVNGGLANGVANIGAVIAGSGNNYLTAVGSSSSVSLTANGNGNNIIVGGSGSSTLTATGSGNNIIIGDQGTSVINGGTGYNLLIGGTTAYDAVLADLQAILGIWQSVNSSSTFKSTIARLMSTTAAFPLNATTVHGNNTDIINAKKHVLDWYFASLASEIIGSNSGDIDTQC